MGGSLAAVGDGDDSIVEPVVFCHGCARVTFFWLGTAELRTIERGLCGLFSRRGWRTRPWWQPSYESNERSFRKGAVFESCPTKARFLLVSFWLLFVRVYFFHVPFGLLERASPKRHKTLGEAWV